MQTLPLLSAASLLAAAVLCAQAPAPAAPQSRPDPNSPANIGRTQLTNYLDDIAAKETAARRATIAAITTRAQAEARQREVRKKILTLIGGLPEKTPLNAKVLGTTQADGFRIEKILYESQPNFPVTALLYLPDAKPGTPQQKLPAIVVSPGHGFTGKASDYTFASTFARNGFAVLSYDPIGQGERLQYPDPADPSKTLLKAATGEHGEAGLQPTLIGDAPSRIVVWDSIRAVDYLISRPEIDSSPHRSLRLLWRRHHDRPPRCTRPPRPRHRASPATSPASTRYSQPSARRTPSNPSPTSSPPASTSPTGSKSPLPAPTPSSPPRRTCSPTPEPSPRPPKPAASTPSSIPPQRARQPTIPPPASPQVPHSIPTPPTPSHLKPRSSGSPVSVATATSAHQRPNRLLLPHASSKLQRGPHPASASNSRHQPLRLTGQPHQRRPPGHTHRTGLH